MKFLSKVPLSPFVLTLYAILSLWVVNFDQTPFLSVIRVLVVTLVITAVIVLVLRLILRTWEKTGLTGGLALLLFLVYGHVYNLLLGKEIGGWMIGRHRYLLAAVVVLFGVGLFLILRAKKNVKRVNQWVNIIACLLLVMAMAQAGNRLVQLGKANQPKPVAEVQNQAVEEAQVPIGDVYYIVMDSYSRQDLLAQDFGFDNSGFIQELEDLGFVIPDCTQSNYDTTHYSMATALNMNYLDALDILKNSEPGNANAADLIKQSEVRSRFKNLGYQFVTFKSAFPFLDITDSDFYYNVDYYQPFYNQIESINFQDLFFRTTIMRIVIEAQEKGSDPLGFLPNFLVKLVNPRATKFSSREYRLYEQYEFELDKLRWLPNLPGKKFVYAHLLITHTPFVYQTNGNIRQTFEDGPAAYRDQVEFVDQQLLDIIRILVNDSTEPPIIILQGDHSITVAGEDRLKILNAYYLPIGINKMVYPTITPINTFRLIFDQYFGAELPLLPDRSYYRKTGEDTDLTYYESSGSCIQ